jgi:hypothetical protein
MDVSPLRGRFVPVDKRVKPGMAGAGASGMRGVKTGFRLERSGFQAK